MYSNTKFLMKPECHHAFIIACRAFVVEMINKWVVMVVAFNHGGGFFYILKRNMECAL